MTRRRKTRNAFNTKLMIDAGVASLIVQKAPLILASFIPMEPMIAKVAGIGAGYFSGQVFKRPDISTLSLTLGVLDFLNPYIDQLFGSGQTQMIKQTSTNGINGTNGTQSNLLIKNPVRSVEDYVRLNDYTSNPGYRQPALVYDSSYAY